MLLIQRSVGVLDSIPADSQSAYCACFWPVEQHPDSSRKASMMGFRLLHKAKLQFRDSNTFLIPTQSPPKGTMRVLIQSVPLIHLSPFPLPEQVNYHQSIDTDDVQSTPAEQKSAGIRRKLAISCSAKINCDFSRLFTPLASCKLTFLFPWICLLEEFSLAPRVPQIERSASVKRDVAASYGVCISVWYSSVAVKGSDQTGGSHEKKEKLHHKVCRTEFS